MQNVKDVLAATKSELTDVEARRLVALDNLHVNAGLARNPRTPLDVIVKLSQSQNLRLLEAILSRPKLPHGVVRKIWETMKDKGAEDDWAQEIAGRGDCPTDLLEEFSYHESLRVMWAAGKNPHLSVKRMGELASGRHVQKLAVVDNVRLPFALFEKLSMDTDEAVRAHIASNRAVPYPTQQRLAFDCKTLVTVGLLDNPNIDTRILWELGSFGDEIITGALGEAWGRSIYKANDDFLAGLLSPFRGIGNFAKPAFGFGWVGDKLRREMICSEELLHTAEQEGSWASGANVDVMGWWEPNWVEGEEERWLMVTSESKQEKQRAGWALTEPGFDGVFKVILGGVTSFEMEDMPMPGNPKWKDWRVYFVGRPKTTKDGDQWVITNKLMTLGKGETPKLSNLQMEYEEQKGPYVAAGLLMTEAHAMRVLWKTTEGVGAGWESVRDWNEAKDKEAKGIANPGKLDILDNGGWERFEMGVRDLYSQREI